MDFWTNVQYLAILVPVARQSLTIRVRFEPNRLGREFLRVAYEMAVPIRRARVRECPPATVSVPHWLRYRRQGEKP